MGCEIRKFQPLAKTVENWAQSPVCDGFKNAPDFQEHFPTFPMVPHSKNL